MWKFLNSNYLNAFKKVIALPVDLVSSAATTIASPFQRTSTVKVSEPDNRKESTDSPVSGSPKSTPPTTPKVITTVAFGDEKSSPLSPNSPTSASIQSPQSSRHSVKSSEARSMDLGFAMHELDMMQDLLSLETVLQLIHINKDAERRVERFIKIGFPGRMRGEM